MTKTISELFEERTFVTNPGTETYLVFQQKFDLAEFCGFLVHEDESAWEALEQNYLFPLFETAAHNNQGLLLDTLVWRAQADFIEKLGRQACEIDRINERAVSMTRESVAKWRKQHGVEPHDFPVLITADIGPRGDAYHVAESLASSEPAYAYHRTQVRILAKAGVDLVCALTMTTVAETVGIVRAAAEAALPVIVSPTVETDGRLPDGTPLGVFIEQVDSATNAQPLLYMVNCAHPSHLIPTLEVATLNNDAWLSRFRGFRANASAKSHAELDNSTELDRGDVQALGQQMIEMQSKYDLRVIGGCCGTDHEHVAAMASKAHC